MTIVFDGKSFAKKKESLLQRRIQTLTEKLGRKPKLLAVGIGREKDIEMYLRMKEKAAERLGVDFEKLVFNEDLDESEVCKLVAQRNNDDKVDGILLELPLPKKFDNTKIMEQVSPQKDPDCMTSENLGRLLYGKPKVLPATVKAIKDILLTSPCSLLKGEGSFAFPSPGRRGDTRGEVKPFAYKNAVVIGGGVELGKPLAMWLSDMGAAVSLCRSTTKDLTEYTQNADIIVSAAGVPNLIKGELVKKGVVVIDAGINFVNGKTAGDVDFESVSKKASFITPVPGGVGPVTIVSLFENLIENF